MAIVGGWVEHGRLALHASDVAAPQVPVQHAGLYVTSHILEEHLQVGKQLVTQLAEPPVTCGSRAGGVAAMRARHNAQMAVCTATQCVGGGGQAGSRSRVLCVTHM